MYLGYIDDPENDIDIGSLVLAALHRWRQEPRRRQRPWRQTRNRRAAECRQERQQGRQAGTREGGLVPPVVTRSSLLHQKLRPLNTTLVAVAEGRTVPVAGEPVSPARVRTALELLERRAVQPVSHALPPTDGTFQIECPREDCRALCRTSEPVPRRSWGEPQPSPCVPAEFLVPDGGGAGLGAGLDGLRCRACGWCVAVRVDAAWTPLEALLRDTQGRGSGWHRVSSVADRAALYLLFVYIYGERERSATQREPELTPPPLGDSALLLFAEDGAAVGFATLKRRGQLLREHAGPERFQMDILDTVYVRRAARRRGRAGALLEALARGAARLGRQLGVTRPTPAMRCLLRDFLRRQAWARHLLFEVTWAAGLNNRTNIWEQMKLEGLDGGQEDRAAGSAAGAAQPRA